jgi:hypothetical protein
MKKILFIVLNLCISALAFSQNYTFVGNGNWTDAANWQNGQIPPAVLPAGSSILINPAGTGECILNTPQTISAGATFTVAKGKKFTVLGNYLVTSDYPAIVTGAAAKIQTTTATLSASVVSTGGSPVSERGICYSFSPFQPCINKVKQGSGTGNFTIDVASLQSNVTYYYKAYAVNSVGISYGGLQSFTTLAAQ